MLDRKYPKTTNAFNYDIIIHNEDNYTIFDENYNIAVVCRKGKIQTILEVPSLILSTLIIEINKQYK